MTFVEGKLFVRTRSQTTKQIWTQFDQLGILTELRGMGPKQHLEDEINKQQREYRCMSVWIADTVSTIYVSETWLMNSVWSRDASETLQAKIEIEVLNCETEMRARCSPINLRWDWVSDLLRWDWSPETKSASLVWRNWKYYISHAMQWIIIIINFIHCNNNSK